MTVKRRIPEMPAYLAWAEQAPQYERPDITDRSPGTHYWRVPPELVDGLVIDCLLHYDEDGLVGILTHYPNGSPQMDRPGDVTLVVHPAKQRRGIGTTLVLETRPERHGGCTSSWTPRANVEPTPASWARCRATPWRRRCPASAKGPARRARQHEGNSSRASRTRMETSIEMRKR